MKGFDLPSSGLITLDLKGDFAFTDSLLEEEINRTAKRDAQIIKKLLGLSFSLRVQTNGDGVFFVSIFIHTYTMLAKRHTKTSKYKAMCNFAHM
jgi:hypothetical protein